MNDAILSTHNITIQFGKATFTRKDVVIKPKLLFYRIETER